MAGETMRDAGIRVVLKKDGFMVSFKGMEQEVKAGGDRMGASLSASLKGGLKGAESAVKGLFSSIKSGVSQLAGFGGALGTTEMIREGLKTSEVFKGIAFQIRGGTGELVNWKGLMAEASSSAQRWGKDVDELGAAMKGIYEETGNADFAKSSIETIAVTARGTKQPISELGELSGTLNEKFGITADTLGDTLAAVYSLGNRGGVTVSELSGKLGIIGATARQAGLQGAAGFSKMVGLLNVADDGGKNLRKNIGAVHQVLETLTTASSRNKAFMQLGIDPSQAKGDVTKQIGSILKATGGSKDKLAVAFQGEGLAFLVSLGQQYATKFKETEGTVKQKTDAALAAYEQALQNASKSQLKFADVQKQAAENMQSAQGKMDGALSKMKASFLRDDIAVAVGKLADVLPKFADMVASLVGFAAEHPVLAAGGAVAGTAANGFVGGAVGGMGGIGAILKTVVTAGSVTSKAAAAKEAATAAATAAAAGKAAAENVSTLVAFRKAVNDGIGPLGKLGLAAGAAAAVMLAWDQASSLNKELGEEGWGDMWKKLKNDVGITTDEEFASEQGIVGNGVGVSGKDQSGEESEYDMRERRRKMAEDLKPGAEEAKNKAMRSFIAADSDDRLPSEAARDAQAAGKGQAAGAPAAPNPGAMAKALAGEELRVRIMNPEALRGGGAGFIGGGPGPGYAERE